VAHCLESRPRTEGADFGICQTFAASPAEPGELPCWFSARYALSHPKNVELTILLAEVSGIGDGIPTQQLIRLIHHSWLHAPESCLNRNSPASQRTAMSIARSEQLRQSGAQMRSPSNSSRRSHHKSQVRTGRTRLAKSCGEG
jgi:hypothetical protein